MSLLISCEVGGNRVPSQLVSSHPSQSSSHRAGSRAGSTTPDLAPGQLPAVLGHDEAARYVAERLSSRLKAPLIANDYSEELIDVSRSLHHRQLFSSLTRSWPQVDRERLIGLIHTPYRARIKSAIAKLFRHSQFVVHLSIRSVALRDNGKYCRTDVGLSYDPGEPEEVDLCLDWIDEMYDQMPMLRVRRNYPRRGTTDSITKAMRSEFAGSSYLGIEMHFNRAWVGRPLLIRDEVIDQMVLCLRAVTASDRSDAA